MKSKYLNFFIYVFILFIFSGYGFIASEKKLPPYFLLKSINQKISSYTNNDKIVFKEIAKNQNINYLETTLIPFEFLEYNLGDQNSETSTSSGAIGLFEDSIFILNKHREVIILDGDLSQTKLFKIKDLDDNNKAFFNKYKKDLRIHDLLIKKKNNEKYLLISYEKYHPNVDKNSLNISYKKIENNFDLSDEDWNLLHEGSLIKYPDYAYSSGGGQLADYDSEHFLMANGDYNLDNWVNETDMIPPSQNFNTTVGKILKINFYRKDYEIITKGHRNPQGLSVSSIGKILQSEHGPNGGDEINRIDIDTFKNYGWPYQSLGVQYIDFNAPVKGTIGSHEEYEMPLFAFVPSIGISEILEIEGFDKRWDGDILVGSLKSRSLYRLRLNDNKVVYVEPIWIGERIRDIKQKDNRIFLWFDNQKLRVYSISEKLLNSPGREANQTELHALLESCLKCHHFGSTNPNHSAPSLSGLFDREIGKDPEYKYYSQVLKESDLYWSKDLLQRYIINPQSDFLGTSMPAATERYTETELNEIITLLENYSSSSIN